MENQKKKKELWFFELSEYQGSKENTYNVTNLIKSVIVEHEYMIIFEGEYT